MRGERPPRTVALVAAMCVAEVLTMLGFSSWGALIGPLSAHWSLSATEAGWVGGAFFGGYTVAVPVLTALTDRVDPKRIWLAGALLAVAGGLGFGWLADGFGGACLARALAGMGLAGTYMPGLKALADHAPAREQSRVVAFYTSSFSIGAAASYLLSIWLADALGWRAVFWASAAAAAVAALLVALVLPPGRPEPQAGGAGPLWDVRPTLRNRRALAYSLCYAAHSWELFGVRTWVVAFLAFVAAGQGSALGAGTVAAAMTVVGVPASILGNELAIRIGRARLTAAVMLASTAACSAMAFAGSLPFWLVAALCVLHGFVMAGESSAVTAGALEAALPGRKGQTMALHSTLGFAGGMLGPLAFGALLDAGGGGAAPLGWTLAYAHLAVVMLAGPLVLRLLARAAAPVEAGAAPGGRPARRSA